MRAPPEAATTISGLRPSRARSTARAIVSPTTAPIEPPMKPYSIALSTTSCGPSCPTAFRIASFSPVCFLRLAQPLLVGLHVGKIQRIGRAQTHVHQLIARLQKQLDALPRADLEVVLALGTDIQVGFKIRLPDRLPAAQALDPQALGANVSSRLASAPAVLGAGPTGARYSPFSRLNQDIPNPL